MTEKYYKPGALPPYKPPEKTKTQKDKGKDKNNMEVFSSQVVTPECFYRSLFVTGNLAGVHKYLKASLDSRLKISGMTAGGSFLNGSTKNLNNGGTSLSFPIEGQKEKAKT